jgi:hypothetical protein
MLNNTLEDKAIWGTDAPEEDNDSQIDITKGEITTSANDFNILTLQSMCDKGQIIIPPFQRRYVWDRKKASMLIDSVMKGLPIPPVYCFRDNNNKWLLIDGQQRLLSIYFFIKGRFPREGSEQYKDISKIDFKDDSLFKDFTLEFKGGTEINHLHGLSYKSLSENDRDQFDLFALRTYIITPADSKSTDAIYEVFNRFNTGGIKLEPQEIRRSLYHSPFFVTLDEVNKNAQWQRLFGQGESIREAAQRGRDSEILLRSLALLDAGQDKYSPSMVKFINKFCEKMKPSKADDAYNEQVDYLKALVESFFEHCSDLSSDAFYRNNRFSNILFESVFYAECIGLYKHKQLVTRAVVQEKINALANDDVYIMTTESRTTSRDNVQTRLTTACEIFG